MGSHLIYISAKFEPAMINLANQNGKTPAQYLRTVCEEFLADKARGLHE